MYTRKSVGIIGIFVAICLAFPAVGDESQWEGTIAAGGYGSFPPTGFYAASDSFPRNTVVTVENLENGKTASVIVVDRLGSEGIFMTVSSEAADELGLSADSIVQARVTLSDDTQDYTESYQDIARSRDPDINPSASFMDNDELSFLESVLNAKGIAATEQTEKTGSDSTRTPAQDTDVQPVGSENSNEPFSVEELAGDAIGTEPDFEDMGSELALALPDRVGAIPETPAEEKNEVSVFDMSRPLMVATPVALFTGVFPKPPEAVGEQHYDVTSLYANPDGGISATVTSGIGSSAELPVPQYSLAQTTEGESSPGEAAAYRDIPGLYDFTVEKPSISVIRNELIESPAVSTETMKWPRLSETGKAPRGDTRVTYNLLPIPVTGSSAVVSREASMSTLSPGKREGIRFADITIPSPPDRAPTLPEVEDTPVVVDVPVSGTVSDEVDAGSLSTPSLPEEPAPQVTDASDLVVEEVPEEEEEEIGPVISPLDDVAGAPRNQESVPEIPEDAIIVLEPAEERPPQGPPDVVPDRQEVPEETVEAEAETDIELAAVPASPGPVEEEPAPPTLPKTLPQVLPEAVEKAEPPESKTVVKIPDSVWVTDSLAGGSHYLQVGTYSEETSARLIASRLAGDYPMTMFVDGGTEKKFFRVMVGPLTPDESGVVLLNLKAEGYKDAFVRKVE